MIGRNGHCIMCLMKKSYEGALALGDAEKANEFLKDIMRMCLDLPDGLDSNWFYPSLAKLYTKHYGLPEDRFQQDKLESNRFVLDRLDRIRQMAQNALDPLFAGLQLAILGNYLDFSALAGQVSFEKLDEMLSSATQIPLDAEQYAAFRKDLEAGRRLLYLTDNAGEIGFDRILCEQIEKEFPHLEITFCVRGAPASNDALREDAQAMGIPYRIIDNGTNMPSTPLDLIGQEAKNAIRGADVIIAKGMGNLESLYGCGYPIYFLFLVKCRRISEYFQKPLMTPMFIKDPGGKPYYDEA